jgi:CubicO group peptidase (beta-lactamase class C family)
MARSWVKTGIGVVIAGAALVAVVVGGIFLYVSATAMPLHPDPGAVPSVADATPPAAWLAAAETARRSVRAAIGTQNLPGLSVAVGRAGEIVWAEGFGFADLGTRSGVTARTRFRIGDVSMPLTSAAVGLLAEERRLNLESDIHMYVPEFPEKPWPVTLRELMGHTAGVRNDAGDEESLQPCDRTLDGLARFADDPLRFEPGTRFRKSSYGWILVSAAVEAAGGQPFYAFMRTRIFEPLGMAATVPYTVKASIPDLPTFYYPRFGGDTRYGPELAREGDHTCFSGAYAFLSTPSDLVRFGMAISGATLLKPQIVEELQTPQRLLSGETTGYGLGWTIESVSLAGRATRMAGHGTKADFVGGATSLLTFPDRTLVVAVTTNESFADTKSIALRVADAFAK